MSIIHRFPYSGSSVAGCNCIGTAILIYILRQKKFQFRDRQKSNRDTYQRQKENLSLETSKKWLFVSVFYLSLNQFFLLVS